MVRLYIIYNIRIFLTPGSLQDAEEGVVGAELLSMSISKARDSSRTTVGELQDSLEPSFPSGLWLSWFL